MMLADGSAAFTKELGMELDLVDRGLGVRSQRFAMIVDNGTVTEVLLDEAGAFEKSSAESVLERL
jgi:peroxiredoxin (alkyl hydroperoxide reductase subunit C)